MDSLTSEQKAAYDEIMSHMAELYHAKAALQKAAFKPTGVILPGRLNHPSDDSDAPAKFMGLKVVWSPDEEWGLIVGIPLRR